MKIELKNKVEKLIENYKKITDSFLSEIRKWEGDSLYASDYRQDKIREVKAQMIQNDYEFNQQLKTIIMEEKEAILNSTIKKPDDFQLQISNALGFINLLGDKLTDERAFEVVKPFFGDYQTMNHFYAVLSNRYGKGGLSVTTFSLGIFDRVASNMDVLKNNFRNFFDAGTYATNGFAFLIGTDALVTDATNIENMVQKLDTIILASYKEVKTENDDAIKEEMGVQ